MARISLSTADIGVREREAVVRAMESGWITPAGPDVDSFEAEVAERTKVEHAIAVSSGTAALHLGLLSTGVGPGTIVPTSTMTFAATANAITYTGAIPFFVDCDERTGNISPDLLDEALTRLAVDGHAVNSVLPVDIYGKVADFERIDDIARRHEAVVVSDSAESVGSTRGGRAAGSLGTVSAFSFNGNKILTTSGGGMVLTDDSRIAVKVRRLATQARQPVAHYLHAEVGYNYRLSNILAALGRAQLEGLDGMIARRRHVRNEYRRAIADLEGVHLLGGEDDEEDNCWLTSIVVDPSTGLDVEMLRLHLESHDIESRRLWNPMHRQPVFASMPRLVTGAADRLFATGLSLPSGSNLTQLEIDRVVSVLHDAIRAQRATR